MKAVLFAAVFLTTTAYGRLGETPNQIESRYGPATTVLARWPDGSAPKAHGEGPEK